MASLRWVGSVEALREIVAETGARGTWRVLPDGAHQFRGEGREVINWWPSTGTVLCQGPPERAQWLAGMLAAPLAGDGAGQVSLFG